MAILFVCCFVLIVRFSQHRSHSQFINNGDRCRIDIAIMQFQYQLTASTKAAFNDKILYCIFGSYDSGEWGIS